MTKKDLIEEIIQNMPENLTQLEKARYIYIELGKQRRFDTRYYYGNASVRRRVFKEIQSDISNPHTLRNKRTIICITLSEIYRSALKEVGIDCEIVRNGIFGDKHVLPIVNLNDEIRGRLRIRADLQQDLESIQAGMSTVEFGNINALEKDYDIIEEDELKKIDKKIGYISEDYRDVDIYTVQREIKDMDANDSLRYILQNQKLNANIHFNGQVERRKYYRYLLDTLVSKYLNKKIFMFTCYREREDTTESEKREFTLCAYSYEQDNVEAYLYSAKEERFLPISLEKLDELQEEGLNLGVRKKTKGVNLLKKFIRDNERKKQKKEINDAKER